MSEKTAASEPNSLGEFLKDLSERVAANELQVLSLQSRLNELNSTIESR